MRAWKRGGWLAVLVALDQASVAADPSPGGVAQAAAGAAGLGDPSGGKSGGFVDLDDDEDSGVEGLAESVGSGNVAPERNRRRKSRKSRTRRKRAGKQPRWKYYLAAGVAASFILLVVVVVVITVLEQFGIVI